MSEAQQRLYEELADINDRKREAKQRDIFLILAADAAFADGRPEDAERLRIRLLQFSPHNLLRPFPSFTEALRSPDIHDYVADLRRQYPPDQAEKLLRDAGAAADATLSREPPVYQFRDPKPQMPGSAIPSDGQRRGRPASKSPYDAPLPYTAPTPPSDTSGRWFTTLLFLLVLAAALALAGWTLVRPLL